jgi:hypothetical protein
MAEVSRVRRYRSLFPTSWQLRSFQRYAQIGVRHAGEAGCEELPDWEYAVGVQWKKHFDLSARRAKECDLFEVNDSVDIILGGLGRSGMIRDSHRTRNAAHRLPLGSCAFNRLVIRHNLNGRDDRVAGALGDVVPRVGVQRILMRLILHHGLIAAARLAVNLTLRRVTIRL